MPWPQIISRRRASTSAKATPRVGIPNNTNASLSVTPTRTWEASRSSVRRRSWAESKARRLPPVGSKAPSGFGSMKPSPARQLWQDSKNQTHVAKA